MITFLRVVRAVVGFFFLLQALHLLPVLTWLENPAGITNYMLGMTMLKVIFLVLFGGAFYGLRVWINRIHNRRYGAPYPQLAKSWMAI